MTIWRPSGWWLGCPALLVLWGLSAKTMTPRIEADLRAGFLAERARLGGDGPLASRITVAGRDLVVTADPGLPSETLDRLAALARDLAGVRRVATATEIPARLDPYPFAIRRDATTLVLEGGVPSAMLRAALLRETAARAPALALDDRLKAASGEPEGFAPLATTLLGLALDLEEAEVSLAGGTVTLRGTAGDHAGYASARAVLAGLPAGLAAREVALEPPLARPWSWSAALKDGTLVLEGSVPSEADRAAIASLATTKVAGAQLRDLTQTARGAPATDVRAVAGAGFGALAELGEGRVTIRDGRVSLAGASPALDLLTAIEARFRASLPVGAVPGDVALAAIPASPYPFSAERARGRVTLAGYLPGEAERAVMRDLAARRFPAEAIRDETHLATGAPDDMAVAAALALSQLAQMAEGRVAISGRSYGLSGRVLYGELASRLRERAEAGLPPGWSVTAEIRGPDGRLGWQVCGDVAAEAARREPVGFVAGARDLAPGADRALAALAAILARCDPVRIRIVAAAPAGADEATKGLARERAQALARRLAEAGGEAVATGIAFVAEVRERAGAGPEIALEAEPVRAP